MKQEKEEFIKKFQKHQIKQTEEDFNKATQGKANLNVVSVEKKKRDSDDDIEEVEKKVKKDKKHSGQKRQKQ